MKDFYFLSGLPRSGATLLSSLLNQNPKIYCSPISPMVEHIWQAHRVANNYEDSIRIFDQTRPKNMIKQMHKNYYGDVKKPIIFDRNKVWASEDNVFLIKEYITKNPKIIFTVRSILEILISFINLIPDIIDKDMERNNFIGTGKNINDCRAEFLMQPGFQIMNCLSLYYNILNKNDSNIFKIIKYDDLVGNTQKTMKEIYDFIELPNFIHNLKNIKKIEIDHDELLGFPKNMHEIKSKIEKNNIDPKDFFSNYIIDKYKNIDIP
jgi:sulfotransferase